MDKSSILNKSNSLRKINLVNNSNTSFLRNTINNDNFYNSNFSPENQETFKFNNLKISPNNQKFFNFIGRSTNHNNTGFLTKTNFKNKKKKVYNYDKDKSSFIVNNTSLLGANLNVDQSINLIENNILTNAGSSYSRKPTNKNLNNVNAIETTLINTVAQDNNIYNNNTNTNTNTNLNSHNNTMLNINMINSPTRNIGNNINNNNLGNQNINNNLNMKTTTNNNLPTIHRSLDRKKTQIINMGKNEMINNNHTIMNNTQKDLNGISKEEKELLNKIGAGVTYRDYNSEKNKFLETIYEKLNDKNTNNLKEQTTDYCQKFLNYSTKDVDELVTKYYSLFVFIYFFILFHS